MKRIYLSILTILMVSLALPWSSRASEEPLLMELAAKTIKISTFYN